MLFKVTTFHFDAFILHNFNSPNANLNKVVIPIGVLKIISFFNLNLSPKIITKYTIIQIKYYGSIMIKIASNCSSSFLLVISNFRISKTLVPSAFH